MPLIPSYSQVLESCVKNCGSLIHEEIATRAFMEELRELLKHTNDENTKQKILEMLQILDILEVGSCEPINCHSTDSKSALKLYAYRITY